MGERLIIDPETTSPGDAVGLWHVRAITARQADPDRGPHTWFGEAHFEGEVELSGRYFGYQPDPPRPPQPCLEVDEDQAHHLPRFPGDERRTWFCFANADEVVDDLGRPTIEGRLTTLVVTDYYYLHVPTDVHNRARYEPEVERERGHVLPEHRPGLAPEQAPAP